MISKNNLKQTHPCLYKEGLSTNLEHRSVYLWDGTAYVKCKYAV